ncbi:hypothetical protein CsSME_00028901 [Camellia sinensis var. sinensis]
MLELINTKEETGEGRTAGMGKRVKDMPRNIVSAMETKVVKNIGVDTTRHGCGCEICVGLDMVFSDTADMKEE